MTAGWGHYGQGDAVMPGQGRVSERAFTSEERAAMGDDPTRSWRNNLRRVSQWYGLLA